MSRDGARNFLPLVGYGRLNSPAVAIQESSDEDGETELYHMFVEGEPALLLTAREQGWIETLNAPGIGGHSALRLRFVVRTGAVVSLWPQPEQ
jgi:hypothetical protein